MSLPNPSHVSESPLHPPSVFRKCESGLYLILVLVFKRGTLSLFCKSLVNPVYRGERRDLVISGHFRNSFEIKFEKMASFGGVQPQSSGLYLDFMTAEENEFLAKETLVTITSRVNHGEFQFISGTFGPLEAGLPCNVPLWFALQLHRSGKCDIKMPDWLSVTSLQETLEIEKESSQFSALPFHFIEIAQLLLSESKDDFESPDQVRNLLQDIENVRMDRIRSGIDVIGENSDGMGDFKVRRHIGVS